MASSSREYLNALTTSSQSGVMSESASRAAKYGQGNCDTRRELGVSEFKMEGPEEENF